MATIAKAALQSAVINAGSNVLAQGIKAYRAEVGVLLPWLEPLDTGKLNKIGTIRPGYPYAGAVHNLCVYSLAVDVSLVGGVGGIVSIVSGGDRDRERYPKERKECHQHYRQSPH